VDRTPKSQISLRDPIVSKFHSVDDNVLVASALVLSAAEGSRRLLAQSWRFDSATNTLSRPQAAAASNRFNSNRVRQQLAIHRIFKLRLALLCLSLSSIVQLNAQTPAASQAATPTPTAKSPASPAPKPGSLEDKVEKYLRNMYAWGPQYEINLGPSKPSPISDLLEIPVTVGLQGQSDTAVVYVSKDAKFIFRGEVTDMTVDPLAETRAKLHPGNSPSMGPADAKITLIEFADFECPSCRQLDRILRELLPQHPEIRLIYKDFPLTTIHPWAMTASIAGQCATQQNPASFWKIHDIIFDAQDLITPSNVWDKMQDFANQVGLNTETFRACMANPETAQQVEKTTDEGHDLNITGTPTIFVNGRRIVGPDEPTLKQFISFQSSSMK
jgi:protein-disulfide isomerase